MKTKKLDSAKNMPPLFHKLPGQEFDMKKSEVIKWLIQQPDILQYIFDKLKDEHLIYDPISGKWRGADYHT